MNRQMYSLVRRVSFRGLLGRSFNKERRYEGMKYDSKWKYESRCNALASLGSHIIAIQRERVSQLGSRLAKPVAASGFDH